MARHRTLARMENNQILEGEQVNQVREFHDHDTHIDEHDDFRNSLEYLMMPQEQQFVCDDHVAQHYEMRDQQIFAMQQEQMMLAPPGPGGPPPEKQPGMESPLDGGNPVGEPQPTAQDQYVQGEEAAGRYPAG
jgi:hypothetical protein